MKLLSILAVCAALVGIGVFYLSQDEVSSSKNQSNDLVSIVLPEKLSAMAQMGKQGFDNNCATCHGENAVGKDGVAPPLVHKIYEPNHHGDESFQRAVAMGVRAHHWKFGNMPAIDGLTRADVKAIISYVRELQKTNGIM